MSIYPVPFSNMMKYKRPLLILAGCVVLLLSILLPLPPNLSRPGMMTLGLLVIAALFWITEPIPLAMTGLLIMVLQPLLSIQTPTDVFAGFGNKAVFFLIGAFILAAGIERSNLHRRIALGFLKRFESSPRLFTFGIMVTCASLSFLMPEHAVAALMLPIILAILTSLKLVPRQSNFATVSILAIAYGCSIGSLGTLIGGARNPLTIGFLSETAGLDVNFFQWTIMSGPVVLLGIPGVWAVLNLLYPLEIQDIKAAREQIGDEVRKMGPIKGREWTVMSVVLLTMAGWVLVSVVPGLNARVGLAGIALCGGLLLFFTGSIGWSDVEKRVPWGIILLYGGAITLGIGLERSGGAEWLASSILGITGTNLYVLVLILILLTIVLTEFMSNTAAVAIMLPVALSISQEASGLNPLVACMLVALAGGLAFMLVIATPGNAIVYSSGYIRPRDLARAGLVAHLICITVLFIIAITYWKIIGVW